MLGERECFNPSASANQLCLPNGPGNSNTLACIDHFVKHSTNGDCEGMTSSSVWHIQWAKLRIYKLGQMLVAVVDQQLAYTVTIIQRFHSILINACKCIYAHVLYMYSRVSLRGGGGGRIRPLGSLSPPFGTVSSSVLVERAMPHPHRITYCCFAPPPSPWPKS